MSLGALSGLVLTTLAGSKSKETRRRRDAPLPRRGITSSNKLLDARKAQAE